MKSQENPGVSLERTKYEENAKIVEEMSSKSVAELSPEELQRLADAKRENEQLVSDAHTEADVINNEKSKESVESRLEEIEREREKLMQNLDALKANTEAVEKTDGSKNELPLKVLGAKVRDICSNFFTKLQGMENMEIVGYSVAISMLAGAAVGGINLAGLEDKFQFASYLPDYLLKPETIESFKHAGLPSNHNLPIDRAAWNWMCIVDAGTIIGTGLGTILKKISSKIK